MASFLTACSFERLVVKSSVTLINNTILSLNEEEDPDIAEKAIASQLKMLEGLIKSDPKNHELLLLAAKGFGVYSFSFVDGKENERAKIFYRRGLNYALRTLTSDTSFADALKRGGEPLQKALNSMDSKKVPALFWAANCWGGLINLSRNSPETLISRPKVEKMMTRVLQLDPNYYYGGPHLFFGFLYGSVSPILGGKLEKSKFHFEKVLEITEGKFLMAHVLYAKSYAIQTQNQTLFEQLLNQVIEIPSDILPSQRLANELAKKEAKKLLHNINDYF